MVSLGYGISVLDSSVSGLGGCPYAKGKDYAILRDDVFIFLLFM
jgi:hydroxymethylglutaryl-CoA lyase